MTAADTILRRALALPIEFVVVAGVDAAIDLIAPRPCRTSRIVVEDIAGMPVPGFTREVAVPGFPEQATYSGMHAPKGAWTVLVEGAPDQVLTLEADGYRPVSRSGWTPEATRFVLERLPR